jgi:hypothetical protein
MENRRILNWKNWSVIRKAQVIAGAIGALVTFVINIPFSIDKYSPVASVLFDLGMALAMPTWAVWQAFGNPKGHLLFVALEIVINSFLCVIAGTLIGWIIRKNKTFPIEFIKENGIWKIDEF